MLRKVDLLFLVLAGLVVAGVALLPSPRDQNPPVPTNEDHRRITAEANCVQCHAAAGIRPLTAKHPKRQDCFRCHRASKDS